MRKLKRDFNQQVSFFLVKYLFLFTLKINYDFENLLIAIVLI